MTDACHECGAVMAGLQFVGGVYLCPPCAKQRKVRPMTDAELCKQNGWKVGDVLERADNKQHMRITGIGENGVIGRQAFNDGGEGGECFWEIAHYDWHKLEPEPAPPSCSWEAKVAELEKQLATERARSDFYARERNSLLLKLDVAIRERDEYCERAEFWSAHCDAANAELDELRNRADSQTDRGDAVITAHAETVVQLSERITELEAQLAQVRAQRNASQDDALVLRGKLHGAKTDHAEEVAKLKAEKAEQIKEAYFEGRESIPLPAFSCTCATCAKAAWDKSNARRVAGGDA